jgi:signal peptidase II
MSHIPDKQCTPGMWIQSTISAYLIFFPLVLIGIISDLWSKKAIFNWLQSQPDKTFFIIDGFLRLVRAENAGAAFGIAYGQRYLLIAVSVIALIIIFAVFFFSKTGTKQIHISLALLAAGVCGNLYDRIFNGGWVRDFIDIVYVQQFRRKAFDNFSDHIMQMRCCSNTNTYRCIDFMSNSGNQGR